MTIHDHPGQATVAGTGSLVVGALLATQLLAADPTECGRPRRHHHRRAGRHDRGSHADIRGRAILSLTGRPPLSRYAGTTVQARGCVCSRSPPTKASGSGPACGIGWVQLIGTRESDFRVEPGDKVAFREDGRKLSRLRSTSRRDS
jgi:hypothetical protein